VDAKERNRQAIHPEGNARRVSDLAGVVPHVPRQAKMIAVIVEAHARRGPRRRKVGDQQFELQRLLPLGEGHDLAHPAEEGIRGHVHLEG